MKRRVSGWSSIACPVCGATPRERCSDLTSGSERRRLRRPHAERVALASSKPPRRRTRRQSAPVVIRKLDTGEIIEVRSQRSIRSKRPKS